MVQPDFKGDYSWNDSVLTKEEVEARMRRKVEAVMKRERALAYAYSHQVIKFTLFNLIKSNNLIRILISTSEKSEH